MTRALAHSDTPIHSIAQSRGNEALERMLLEPCLVVAHAPALAHQVAPAEPLDRARFEQLFVAHYRWVWRTLRRLGVPQATVDDAAQQVFLVASDRLEQIAVGKEPAFLMGVTVRIAANARRREVRRCEDPNSDRLSSASGTSDPEMLLEWKQRREKLDDWLAVLAPELRLPFVLFELDGMSLVEIAALLELPVGTVKTRLRRARALFLEAADLDAGGAR